MVRMGAIMTTTSTLTEVSQVSGVRKAEAIRVAERLHAAIVEWGVKRGLRAYRVLTATDSFFEIFDPKTGKTSYDFPEKIKASIAKFQAELRLYAEDTRSRDRRWFAASKAGGIGSSLALASPGRNRQGGQFCDCNGLSRSPSPINGAAEVVKADGSAEAAGPGSGENVAPQARKVVREVDFCA